MRKRGAVRQTKEVKVDVKTLDGKDVTWERATQSVGSVLRIAPAFRARSTDEGLGVDTSLDVRYAAAQGRYVIDAVTNRSVRAEVEINYPTVAKVRMTTDKSDGFEF